MICGGEEGKDTCQGDSGGPNVVNVDGKERVLILLVASKFKNLSKQ